jgi:hypothetical protein
VQRLTWYDLEACFREPAATGWLEKTGYFLSDKPWRGRLAHAEVGLTEVSFSIAALKQNLLQRVIVTSALFIFRWLLPLIISNT